MTPRRSLIVAVARNGVIGAGNRLPWRLPADLKRFRALTMGHHIVMGRRTWESIGRPLPGRISVVVTRSAGFTAPGCTVAHSVADALAACDGDDEVFFVGGAAIYAEALPLVQRVYLTEVHADVPGDTRFPPLDRSAWREVERTEHPADADHAHACAFVVLERAVG